MEANESKRRLSGLHCFVFKFRLFQGVFDQLNLLKYCGIKVNGSKEKPSRFLQVQLISVWLIRYIHCKLIKLTFFVPFTKNSIFKQNVDFLLKVYLFYAVQHGLWLKRIIAAVTGTCIFGDAATFIKDCRVLLRDTFIVPFLGSAFGLTAMCSPGWGN